MAQESNNLLPQWRSFQHRNNLIRETSRSESAMQRLKEWILFVPSTIQTTPPKRYGHLFIPADHLPLNLNESRSDILPWSRRREALSFLSF
jgi:hypothetical protein